MGAFEELTTNEREAFNELKSRVINDLNEEMKNDTNLFLRFLRARDFNVDAAETMLKNHLSWRKALQVDTILTNYVPDEVVVKYLPLKRIGFDKDGCPVIYFAFGNMDSKGILKYAGKNAVVKAVVKSFEEDLLVMKEQSKKLGRPIEQWTYILNYENYSFAKATHKTTLDALVSIFMTYEANYPERLKAGYILNTSVYFNILFQVLKPLLSGATLKKLTFCKKDSWKDDLRQAIHMEDLPAFLGGEKTDPDGNPLCNTFVIHGTLVPPEYFQTKNTRRLKGQPGVRKLTVSRMSKTHLPLSVREPGSNIEWEFETESKDIGFGLCFRDSNQDPPEELIPKQRIDTQLTAEVGMFQCDRPGTYILTFDNSYSWIYQKEIYCKAGVITPKERQLTTNA